MAEVWLAAGSAVAVGVAGAAASAGANALLGGDKSSASSASYPKYPANAFAPVSNVTAPGSYGAPYYTPTLSAYNPATVNGAFNSAYGVLQNAANQTTANNINQRNLIMPGASQQLAQGSADINALLQGQVPQDVVNQTNRDVAQRTGGINNPFTGGGLAQSDFARSIGQTSTGLMQAGLSAAPAWQSLAQSFIVQPQTFAPLYSDLGQQQYQYDALNANQTLATNQINSGAQLATNQLNAQTALGYANLNNGINEFNSSGGFSNSTAGYQGQVNSYNAQQLAQQAANQNAIAQTNQATQLASTFGNIYKNNSSNYSLGSTPASYSDVNSLLNAYQPTTQAAYSSLLNG